MSVGRQARTLQTFLRTINNLFYLRRPLLNKEVINLSAQVLIQMPSLTLQILKKLTLMEFLQVLNHFKLPLKKSNTCAVINHTHFVHHLRKFNLIVAKYINTKQHRTSIN